MIVALREESGLLLASTVPEASSNSTMRSKFGEEASPLILMLTVPAPDGNANTSTSLRFSITPLALICELAGNAVAAASVFP